MKLAGFGGVGGACARRSPHGERGLKYLVPPCLVDTYRSLSSWRAWIEIGQYAVRGDSRVVALLMESVD